MLTRIFLLTHEYQSLVREITTPSLPPFITAAFNVVKPKPSSKNPRTSWGPDSLLHVVLQAFAKLIVLHPTSFRPSVPQIQTLIYPLIAPTPSTLGAEAGQQAVSGLVSQEAQRLFALLHVCAPKNTAAEEWSKSFLCVIDAAQRTADKVFRGFIEDRRPRARKTSAASLELDDVVRDRKPEPLTLPGWEGIHTGVERLEGLLNLLQAFLSSQTSVAVTVPVSGIAGLADRVLSVVHSRSQMGSRTRPEIGKDEREGFELALPQLHKSAIGLLSTLLSRIGTGCTSISHSILVQVLQVLDVEDTDDEIRESSYACISLFLSLFGPTLPVSCASLMSRCVHQCCEDLLDSRYTLSQRGELQVVEGTARAKPKASAVDADSYLKSDNLTVGKPNASAQVVRAAETLLPLFLTTLPQGYLSTAARHRIDRTAVLVNHKEALLASVMNATTIKKDQGSTSSILPLVARANDGNLGLEALLRPQMPLVQARSAFKEAFGEDEDNVDPPREDHNRSYSDSYKSDLNLDREVNPHQAKSHGLNGHPRSPSRAHSEADSVRTTPDADVGGSVTLGQESSFISYKRSRDNGIPTNSGIKQRDSLDSENEASIGEAPSSKRPRHDLINTEQSQPIERITHDLAAVDDSMRQRTDQEDVAAIPQDSDESDFEMPPLDLELGSDSEDEDEEGDNENI